MERKRLIQADLFRYNSAVFEVTIGRNYNIHFVNSSDHTFVNNLASSARNLTNSQWQSLYDTQYVPDAGDLYLVVDKFGLSPQLSGGASGNWSYVPVRSLTENNDFIDASNQSGISASTSIALNLTDLTFSLSQPSSIVTFNVGAYNKSTMPIVNWPNVIPVNASWITTWQDVLYLDDQGWMSNYSTNTLNSTTVHSSYAFSTPTRDSSSIQIGLVFMIVVLICNFLKAGSVYLTWRGSFSERILTLGDAASSYLEMPDMSTLGACCLSKNKLIDSIKSGSKFEALRWRRRRVHYITGFISGDWITYTTL